MSPIRILVRKGKPGGALDGLVYYRDGKAVGHAVLQEQVMVPHDSPEMTTWEWRDLPVVLE